MKLSNRNEFAATIKRIKHGPVGTEVTIQVAEGVWTPHGLYLTNLSLRQFSPQHVQTPQQQAAASALTFASYRHAIARHALPLESRAEETSQGIRS